VVVCLWENPHQHFRSHALSRGYQGVEVLARTSFEFAAVFLLSVECTMTRWGSAMGTLSVTLLWGSVMWHAWIAWVWNLMLNLSHETTVAIDSVYNCEGILEHLWRLSYKSFTLRSKVVDNVKRAISGASNFIPCSGDYWRTAVIVHGRLIFDTLLRCRNVYISIIFKVSAASIDGH